MDSVRGVLHQIEEDLDADTAGLIDGDNGLIACLQRRLAAEDTMDAVGD